MGKMVIERRIRPERASRKLKKTFAQAKPSTISRAIYETVRTAVF